MVREAEQQTTSWCQDCAACSPLHTTGSRDGDAGTQHPFSPLLSLDHQLLRLHHPHLEQILLPQSPFLKSLTSHTHP